MRKYSGIPINIDHPIIAKVSKSPIAGRLHKNSVLVAEAQPKLIAGYKAIICGDKCSSDRLKASPIPVVYGVSEFEDLEEGDIVLIEPSGLINVLFKRNSNDNVIMLTESCNADCLICSQPTNNSGFILSDPNRQLIGLVDIETTNLAITGGEPTLERSKLIETLASCKMHLPNTEIDLLTNGMLLADFDYVKEIVSVGHPNIVFQIPLYADTDSLHNKIVGTHGFYQTIKGLYNLALFNQKIEIRTVICSLNYERMPQFAEFIYRNFPFVFHVALMGLEVIHKARENIRKVWVDPLFYQNELLEAVQILHRAHINVSIYNHQLCVIPRSLWRFARRSISDWKRRFLEICEKCDSQRSCGGIFATSGEYYSKYLQPVTAS